ncbi:MAG: secondary thiamine-phosphate synthase enzyme YjbQ [Candidatus Binatia bacterium]
MQRELTVHSARQHQVVDLTAEVARVVADSGVAEGLCHVYVPHATAAVVINENDDPNIGDDLLDALDRLVPQGQWRHDRIDANGAAHIKAALLGPGETVPVCNARLQLGTWQAIMLVDLDGPRQRRVIVTVR